MAWNPSQYLKFADERKRPAIDLIARIPLDAPRTIVDLGCGAGNVTRLLADRWPQARVVGVDSSREMLERARASIGNDARFEWSEGDIASWRPSAGSKPDLVFSNAALHWLDDHETLLPRLLASAAEGGALAVQMPHNFDAPAHVALFDLARSARFRAALASRVRERPVALPAAYYQWLSPHASSVDIWTTEYLHVLARGADGEHPVVAWNSATAMTPFTTALDAAAVRAFVDEYRSRIATLYPLRADGRVLFAFRRLFIVARRNR
jgi:trans-aconitate 2-methyltransferase